MARAFIAVGSNLDPAENVRRALRLLAAETRLVGISTIYRTRPLARPGWQRSELADAQSLEPGQPDYYNCVVAVETDLPPLALRERLLRQIEAALGRERNQDKFASRTIDLDLIAYDDLAIQADGLELPDPDIWRRPFVAIPLAELAPELRLPGPGGQAKSVAAAMPKGEMEALASYTEELRRDILHEP